MPIAGGAGGLPSSGGALAAGGNAGATTSATGGGGGAGGFGVDSELLPSRTWRLSHEQYKSSVAMLVGVEPDLGNFKPESGNGMFANFSSTSFVQVDLASNYFQQALSIAEGLPRSDLAALTSCPLDASCKTDFIEELGRRAFRSDVPPEVSTRLSSVFDSASVEDGEEVAFRAVLAAILNSPLFLYRKEIGSSEFEAGADVSLTGDQVAEFLSFSLLDAPPPDWLTEQARTASLDETSLGSMVDRLMLEPGFEEQLGQFLAEWIEVTHFDTVEKFEEAYPGFEQVRGLIEEETGAFLEQSGRPDSGLSNLLLDPVVSVSPALDAFYFSDPSAPTEAERLGVLGLGTVLSSHAKSYLTSPTLRGTFIRKRFFCQEITLPDDFTPPSLSVVEEAGTARTTRELYEQHQTDPLCAACHNLTDNIGFALEEYDGAGRFRTQDSTQGPPVPLDLATEITLSDVNRPLSGAKDLSVALSESAEVKACFARQAFRFYFGQVERTKDVVSVAHARERLIASDRLADLLVGLFSTTDTFIRSQGAGD